MKVWQRNRLRRLRAFESSEEMSKLCSDERTCEKSLKHGPPCNVEYVDYEPEPLDPIFRNDLGISRDEDMHVGS